MSDLIHLMADAEPWHPSPDVEDVALLDEYSMPLAGIIRQGGNTFLYVCAAGEEEDANVWLYVNVETAEVDTLKGSRGSGVVSAMKQCIQNRNVIAALAADGKLVMWDRFDTGIESPGVIVRRFLKRLEARMRRYGDNIVTLEHDPSLSPEGEEEEALLC